MILDRPRDRRLELHRSLQEIAGPAKEFVRHLATGRNQRLELCGGPAGPSIELLRSQGQVGLEVVEHLDPVVHVRDGLLPVPNAPLVPLHAGDRGVMSSISLQIDSCVIAVHGRCAWTP